MAHPIEITEATFDSEVGQSSEPVLIDFWAAWCGPCRAVAPVVESIADDYAGRLKVGKVDVDSEPGLAMRFGVSGIPAIMLFKGGQVVARAVGARPKAALVSALALDDHVEGQAA
jgi:thioredoxin